MLTIGMLQVNRITHTKDNHARMEIFPQTIRDSKAPQLRVLVDGYQIGVSSVNYRDLILWIHCVSNFILN